MLVCQLQNSVNKYTDLDSEPLSTNEDTIQYSPFNHIQQKHKNGRCYQLDHFVACARDMKRICYAGPATRQLVVSDHKTIKMTIKIARNLKKSRQPYDDYDLSQLGMKKVADQGGGTKMVPNENTIAFLEAAEKKFNSIQIGPFQSTAQETDEKYDAVVTALNEATKTLPKKKKHEPWFAKGQAGIH